MMLGAKVDGVIVVARARLASRPHMVALARALDACAAPTLGFLFTGVSVSEENEYGGYVGSAEPACLRHGRRPESANCCESRARLFVGRPPHPASPVEAGWEKHERTWVTFDLPDGRSLLDGEQVVWAHHPTTRNVRNLVRNSVLAVRELRRLRPDVVVSTGAAVAFPFFLAARAMGIPTVYVEVYDRIDSPTLTGRLCRPLSTLFCVQWSEQTVFYKGSQLVGSLM